MIPNRSGALPDHPKRASQYRRAVGSMPEAKMRTTTTTTTSTTTARSSLMVTDHFLPTATPTSNSDNIGGGGTSRFTESPINTSAITTTITTTTTATATATATATSTTTKTILRTSTPASTGSELPTAASTGSELPAAERTSALAADTLADASARLRVADTFPDLRQLARNTNAHLMERCRYSDESAASSGQRLPLNESRRSRLEVVECQRQQHQQQQQCHHNHHHYQQQQHHHHLHHLQYSHTAEPQRQCHQRQQQLQQRTLSLPSSRLEDGLQPSQGLQARTSCLVKHWIHTWLLRRRPSRRQKYENKSPSRRTPSRASHISPVCLPLGLWTTLCIVAGTAGVLGAAVDPGQQQRQQQQQDGNSSLDSLLSPIGTTITSDQRAGLTTQSSHFYQVKLPPPVVGLFAVPISPTTAYLQWSGRSTYTPAMGLAAAQATTTTTTLPEELGIEHQRLHLQLHQHQQQQQQHPLQWGRRFRPPPPPQPDPLVPPLAVTAAGAPAAALGVGVGQPVEITAATELASRSVRLLGYYLERDDARRPRVTLAQETYEDGLRPVASCNVTVCVRRLLVAELPKLAPEMDGDDGHDNGMGTSVGADDNGVGTSVGADDRSSSRRNSNQRQARLPLFSAPACASGLRGISPLMVKPLYIAFFEIVALSLVVAVLTCICVHYALERLKARLKAPVQRRQAADDDGDFGAEASLRLESHGSGGPHKRAALYQPTRKLMKQGLKKKMMAYGGLVTFGRRRSGGGGSVGGSVGGSAGGSAGGGGGSAGGGNGQGGLEPVDDDDLAEPDERSRIICMTDVVHLTPIVSPSSCSSNNSGSSRSSSGTSAGSSRGNDGTCRAGSGSRSSSGSGSTRNGPRPCGDYRTTPSGGGQSTSV